LNLLKTPFLIIFCFALSQQTYGQFIQGGVSIGRSVYWGDLNAPDFSKNIANNGGTALDLFLKRNFNTQFGGRLSILIGKLQGSDANSPVDGNRERNLSFKSNIFELAVTGEYYLFGFDPFTNEKPFSPYGTLGIGALYFNPKTIYKGTEYELQPLGTEGQGLPNYGKKYSKYALVVPFGAGAVLKVNRSFDVSFDIIARRTFTDFIDDVSGNYVNYDELKNSANGPLAAALGDRTGEYLNLSTPFNRKTGEQRGGAKVKDWYFTAMVRLAFTLAEGDSFIRKKTNYRSSCPEF
jgi:hypothetical protein